MAREDLGVVLLVGLGHGNAATGRAIVSVGHLTGTMSAGR
jgi:hypothetical protein